MPNIITFNPETNRDDLIPMEQWDGECWKTMFNTLAELVPQADPWDCLAAFIKRTLIEEVQHGQGNTESKNT